MPRLLRSLHSRLLVTYLALGLLGVGGLTVWTGLRLQHAVVEQAEHNLELEAVLIGASLGDALEHAAEGEGSARQTLRGWIAAYAERTGAQLAVYDRQLRLLASSLDPPPPYDPRSPELVAALRGTEQHDIRWDEGQREERLFVAGPVTGEEGQIGGVVQLSVPMAPLDAQARRTWLSLLSAVGVILAVTVAASLLLSRQVAGPVGQLTTLAEQMAAGDLGQRVTPAGPDELQRLGQAFNRMAERVQEMLARQQSFVANAAHELRSPLTSIRLRIDLLRRVEANPRLAAEYLDQVERDMQHLERLVTHLLMLSRSDAGLLHQGKPQDLAPLLYELADAMAPLAQAAGLRLSVDVPPHLPPVAANSDSIRMVVRNLLDNAIKYTPAGGWIQLQARPADGGEAGVVVQVSDNGRGIPAEHLEHVFERFYRVPGARGDKPAGAGLGLALVRSIVEELGGRVRVQSIPGRGSTFSVHLPATPSP